ncbi:hypothetical protein FZX09_01165 [Synechococcus sp. MU1643]|nr:hypothetical protein [Synechococcus sp. MU1643]
MQRICGQVFVWFGVVVLGVSLYKFISAFWLDASPWPELQLGAAGLILVAAGRIFRKSAFITTLLAKYSPSARARRSFLMTALASFIMGCDIFTETFCSGHLSLQASAWRRKNSGVFTSPNSFYIRLDIVAHLQRSPQALFHAPAFSSLHDHFFDHAVCWPRGGCLGANPVRLENT